jgi:hypothetical protein
MIAAMTMPTMTHPGTVDWSGENPGMYLKESADGPFSTLVSFFRVVASPHGRGHALILLERPLLHTSIPEGLNVCVTDNEALARYLASDFAAHFGAFKGAEALQYMDYVKLTGVAASGDTRSAHMEWVKGDGVEASLSWENLGEPFMVSIPKEKSATGRHALFSLFVDARHVTATVNGRTLKGRPVPREFAGRQSSTAFLAYSETWIRV